jgi:peptidoglycan/LPS O-acetylase OafA/YrhL/lysophospholipase L1-like esterase
MMSRVLPSTGSQAGSAASGRLTYQPALDGLRAVALLGVVAYHAGIVRFRGGFLGVSAFFTLSGFLITSLLLAEKGETGRVALGSFWARRVRRLLPAALMTVAGTIALAAVIADDSQLARLRVDSLSSLFHFSNWRFIASGDSYGALFDSPSFFRHFWSLAVEEQYYVVFPIVVAGGLRLWRGPGRAFTTMLGLLAAAGVIWPLVLLANGATTDRLYFGTDTRVVELVLGALLALWWTRRGREVPDRPVPLTIAAIGAVGVLAVMWGTANPADLYLYRGGLALHGLLTIVLIIAAIAPRGPVRAVLAWEPLRRLGVISYGAYLFHWPILLLLQQKTSLGPEQRFLVGLPITIVLASLSHRFVEMPIRRGAGAAVGRRIWVAVPASLTVAAMIVAVTVWRAPAEAPIDFAAAEADLVALVADASQPPSETAALPSSSPVATAPAAPLVAGAVEIAPQTTGRPVRIAGFGDSTALMTGLGVALWAADNPGQITPVVGQARLGCGLVTGGVRKLEARVLPVGEDCDSWLTEWGDSIRGDAVDVAMVQLGAWDIVDHQIEPGGRFLAIGRDAEYEALLRTNLEAAIDVLLEDSKLVVLLAHPDIGQGRLDTVPAGTSYPEYDPARAERWREILRETAAANPSVVVVDLAGWVDAYPDGRWLRVDGVHFTYESTRVVADWLAPELLATYDTWLAAQSEAADTR